MASNQDVEDRLKAALADRYTVEREVGAGGMATVYLAQDLKHGRKVAIKVLDSELAVAVGAERFLREIETIANLTHPHILPLFDSGEAEGFLYYVMPFVKGESLRARLSKEKQLPVGDAIQITKEIADALAYAHEEGVIHRDVKPANIMMEAGHAVLADFGVAHAVAEAKEERITRTGMSLGTPAYMSPEQSTADPAVDGRSDQYALGCVLYEMLAGQPPFTGVTAESVVRQHLAEEPPSITQVRPSVAEEVATVIRRALAKSPADRFRTTGEMAAALALATTDRQRAHAGLSLDDRPVWQIVVGHVVASVLVFGASGSLMEGIGLPTWVPTLTGLICVLALPLVLATAVVQRRAADDRAVPSSGLRKRLTWRMVGFVVGVAFGLLATGTSGYMGMRVMGIGPAGTLWATGVLDAEEPIVLADFRDNAGDSILAHAVTDAFRVDLSQSPSVKVADQAYVAEVLRRMERDPDAPLDLEAAREVAIREGLKAVIGGEVNAVGSGFMLSVRLIVADTGEELASLRATAAESGAIIPAIEGLSRRLRDRIGESLKAIRQTPSLYRVRTASLQALERYSEGSRANNRGDFDRCVTLMTDAIASDTLFAAAYWNRGGCRDRAGRSGLADYARAYRLRDRMTPFGRAMATASYHGNVRGEHEKAVEALEAYLDLYPDDPGPLLTLGWYHYRALREFARAEEVIRRLFEATPTTAPAVTWYCLASVQFSQGKFDEAQETVRRWEEAMPGNAMILAYRLFQASARWDYEAARAYGDTLAQSRSPAYRTQSSGILAYLARSQGRLEEAEQRAQQAGWTDYRRLAWIAYHHLLVVGDTAVAVALLEEGLASLDSLSAADRVYLDPAYFYALVGQPDRARELLAEWERVTSENLKLRLRADRRKVEGTIVLAEGNPEEAIAHLRFAHEREAYTPIAYLPDLGRAYEQAGEPDSALAQYERFIATPAFGRQDWDALWLPIVYERLAALYEERGEVERAIEFYGRFIDLWQDCDSELRPRVEAAERAVARLQGGNQE